MGSKKVMALLVVPEVHWKTTMACPKGFKCKQPIVLHEFATTSVPISSPRPKEGHVFTGGKPQKAP